ncbi:class I SAM-dependent methyltransferase [Dictyobacter aurantiacus]|uniref:Methyltransferase domain-containing protein n=1 Tax=Dictyobacter aurantiacus TaxID=1936993 RepID=A0A401ZDH3_9CHLR|nr:class I SAM-dependent methyltransferase [Dictyobacter aurantiacus]GCE04748.1 hypothetical protein KDAU_20770 [Dictyobacter aurantiacus]
MPEHGTAERAISPQRTGIKRWVEERLFPEARERYKELDWERAAQLLRDRSVTYPDYFLVPHHGLVDGYMSACQAFSWELIEHIFGIRRVRPRVLTLARQLRPQRIIDLGSGTGLTSIELLRSLPGSQLILLDLSPYQLVAAEQQVRYAGVGTRTRLMHARAEETGLADGTADLVMASLLFHELPCLEARLVMREAHRLLAPNGHLLLFDAIQEVTPWRAVNNILTTLLATLMHEIYWHEYMSQPLWELCQEEQFIRVRRTLLFAFPWIYQVVLATRA